MLILVAATGARTTALGLNRILDRHLDALNPRTASRALPAGAISLRGAVVVAVLAFIVALAAAWAISPRCLVIAPIPLAAFVGYPLLKRTTRWAHLGLGVTLALGPLCGFYAVALEWRDLLPIVMLSTFTALWSAGFDILYATLDEESDRRTGVFSLPAAIGSRQAARVAAGMHALAFAALMILFSTSLHGAVSGLLFTLTGGLFVLQHLLRQHVNLAFFHVNAVLGCVVFLGILLSQPSIPGS